MKKILLLLVKKNIIRFFDFYFSLTISKKNEKELMFLSACLSYFTGKGNVCLPLILFEKKAIFSNKNNKFLENIWGQVKFEKTNWMKKIICNQAVTTDPNNIIAPIVIKKKSVYLFSMWKLEKQIINFIKKKESYKICAIKNYVKIINILFKKKDDEDKKLAILISLMNKTSFIVGKPGTGKTTIIAKLILAFSIINKKKINIALSSPTGKSTVKLAYSVKKTLLEIKNNSLINHNQVKFTYIVKTLHSLLGISNNFSKPYYHKNHVLKFDLLIIDESSMIDIYTFCKIIDSLSKNTITIFIGDVNQLPPINAGSIFKDIFKYYKQGYTIDIINKINKILPKKFLVLKDLKKNYISNKFVILHKNHRFEKSSNIDFFSNAVLNNDIKIISKIFKNKLNKICFFQIENLIDYKNMIKNITTCYYSYFKCIQKKDSPKKIIASFLDHQALCTNNISNFGTKNLNKNIECYIQKKNYLCLNNSNKFKKNLWYEGKPIIVTKNYNILEIYNGDIGIVLYDKNNELKIFFLLSDNKIKKISCNLITHYKLAWFISVHRSQGSEYKSISFVVFKKKNNFISKELLYTAITRAKKEIFIYGKKNTFKKSIMYTDLKMSNIYSE